MELRAPNLILFENNDISVKFSDNKVNGSNFGPKSEFLGMPNIELLVLTISFQENKKNFTQPKLINIDHNI